MRQQTRSSKEPVEKVVQDIQRPTRKYYSAINTWGAVSIDGVLWRLQKRGYGREMGFSVMR